MTLATAAAALLIILLAGILSAARSPAGTPGPVLLWPDGAPGARGDSPEDARRQLVAAGLAVTIKDFVGPLEGLLPVDTTVCGTDPQPGTKVTRGTTVQVSVAKLC